MDKQMTFGAIPSKYDPRDYTVKMLRPVAYPEAFEQSDVEIYDQGSIGNCVMQAIRSCPHVHYGKEFGATFGYGRWRSHDGKGMYPNEACNGFVKDGIPPVSADKQWLEVPEAINYAQSNETAMLKAGAPYKGWTWARMHTIDEIKATLMQGVRCIVCLPYVGITNGRWLVDGQVAGYHEMCIIGWTKDGWTVRNSWGKTGGLFGGGTGYVAVAFDDIFACDDVIALFPPEKKEDDPVEPRRTLRLKDPYMRGDDVKEFQAKVKAHGFDPGGIDGVFGKNSDTAAKGFQRAKGLVVDGIVGAKTWAALDKDPDDKITRFISWLKERVGDIYVWGGQGETNITEAWIKRRETSTANANRVIKLWKQRVSEGRAVAAWDCSGLITEWLLREGLIKADTSSRGLWRLCTEITRAELVPGDLVFHKKLGVVNHVGVYIGGSEVIEAKGRDDGVVKRGINASGADYWTNAGRLNIMK